LFCLFFYSHHRTEFGDAEIKRVFYFLTISKGCDYELIKNTKVKSIAKALTLIDFLSKYSNGVNLNEISENLNMSKSTVSDILSTLKDFSYVEQSTVRGKYKLGIRLFEIGNIVKGNMDIHNIAVSYIEEIVKEMKETVHLAILDDGDVLYIDKREANNEFKIVSQIGARLPAHCTAVGKVLLAALSDDEIEHIVERKGLPKKTENTITNINTLFLEISKIREKGYAIDNEEIISNLKCVAAPIKNHEGKVIAALSISCVKNGVYEEKFARAIKKITETTNIISKKMGMSSMNM